MSGVGIAGIGLVGVYGAGVDGGDDLVAITIDSEGGVGVFSSDFHCHVDCL